MLERLFEPRSVLLTGVSPEPGNLAFASLHNLVTFGYRGEIHLLGRKPASLMGHVVRTSWDEIPDGIDVVVVLTPARTVAETLDQCGRKGIRHAIVQSAGFKELGPEGEALAEDVLAVARRHGIRFTGPNGLGVMHPSIGFMPIFVPLRPQWRPGGVSIASQSGGMGFTYMYALADQNVGLAKIVSMGNKLDLDEVDYVRHFTADTETTGIALYLEGICRGRELFEALRDCPKPVVVMKAGHTEAGTKMAFSHTAALTTDDAVLDAMLAQAGAVRAHSQQEVITLCKAFDLPPVRGNRVAVVSRSGGHAVVAADCAWDCGFELPPFPPELLPTGRNVIKRGNPMDLGDVFDFDLYAKLLEDVVASPAFDAVLMLFGYFPPFETESARRLLPTVKALQKKYDKPVLLSLLADEAELTAVRRLNDHPYFNSVEEAFAALKVARAHTVRLEGRPAGATRAPAPFRTPGLRHHAIGSVPTHAAYRALEELDVAVAPYVLARTRGDLDRAPAFPVAVKIASAKAVHKTEAGGVRLGIADRAALDAAFADLADRFGPFEDGEGVLVQSMAAPGVEAIVGATRDPVFGPVVMVGLGGVLVEVLKDTALRLAPVSLDEARSMIRGLKAAALFDGPRGRAKSDVDALARVVHTVSQWVAADSAIQEIDLNPVIVHSRGCTVVDVRIRL